MSWDSPDTRFHVVVNEEEQYSIWPNHKPVPAGWRTVGVSGPKEDCLATSSGCGPTCARSACAAFAPTGLTSMPPPWALR